MDDFDPLHDIHHYSPTLTITQLLKFCERKSLGVTRPMVQNYIRDGLLPPPNGRTYTHKHLTALVVIQKLKTVFDMPTIKTVLQPYLDNEGLPPEVYNRLMDTINLADKQWETHVNPMEKLPLMLHISRLKMKLF
jgi:DNA-binding transcriptional MerR regulator